MAYDPQSDPWLAQAQAIARGQTEADAAQLAAGVRRSLIDFGAVPDLGGAPWAAYADDLTRKLAEESTKSGISVMARLQEENQRRNRRIRDVLAARGLLSSGETGYQLGEEAMRFKRSAYDASRQLLDYLSGAYAAFAQRESERQFGLLQAQQEAAQRAQELAFQQQQMQQEMMLAQQQMMMASADTGGFDQSGGFDVGGFLNSLGGAQFDPSSGMMAATPAPSPQELQIMVGAVKKPARKRTPQEQQLFATYSQWRQENPGWWK